MIKPTPRLRLVALPEPKTHDYATPELEAVDAILAIRVAARKLEGAFSGSFVTDASRRAARALALEIEREARRLADVL